MRYIEHVPQGTKDMKLLHTFHIPVMGTGFSIDTPIKVAKYGISSVISLVDDSLIEQMRQFYCRFMGEPYTPITDEHEDHRATRITEYLNLVDRIVKKQFEELKNSVFEIGSEITKYFELLPDHSPAKALYKKMLQTTDPVIKIALQQQLRESIRPGDINVNIMTKLDKPNFAKDGRELPMEFSDALAALRGYAKSTLDSAIVFSAGINRRLYSYIEQFKDFYADASGFIKKRIIIKVSDYRSAITQGKFLAKKGLWVSEYRIESGLNCGGHVFPAAGELMGPILEEFKTRKDEFINSLHEIYSQALKLKNLFAFIKPHTVKITAQGGIGTAKEDKFIREFYNVDSTGWGTPFLLVPEATNNDKETLEKLAQATEDDLFISDVSPLGVPFNNLRTSASELEKINKITHGRPGSSCPKGYLVSNREFTEKPICTASRLYQKLKLDQIAKLNLDQSEQEKAIQNVTKKSCICNDLGEGAILKNDILTKARKLFPAVCPGPNIAYFSKIATLHEMVGHIYGRANLLNSTYRPHMFIKEIKVNIDFLKSEIEKRLPKPSEKDLEYFHEFKTNLFKGIEYYRDLLPKMIEETAPARRRILKELFEMRDLLKDLIKNYPPAFPETISKAAETAFATV